MTTTQKQNLVNDLLADMHRHEHDFPVISDAGGADFWLSKKAGETVKVNADALYREMKGYKGLALEINDHGNVTVFRCFKNGNRREIASRV